MIKVSLKRNNKIKSGLRSTTRTLDSRKCNVWERSFQCERSTFSASPRDIPTISRDLRTSTVEISEGPGSVDNALITYTARRFKELGGQMYGEITISRGLSSSNKSQVSYIRSRQQTPKSRNLRVLVNLIGYSTGWSLSFSFFLSATMTV